MDSCRTPRPAGGSIPVCSWLAKKNRGYYIAGYAILIFLGLWTAFPVYWQIATSLRSDADLYTPVVSLIPRAWTLDHYYNVLFGARSQFGIQFVNSLIVGVSTTLIAVFFGAMAGYALTRLRFLGRAGLARVLVYSYLAPGTILFIPLYVMANNFGMRDTLSGAGAGAPDVLGAVLHLGADGVLQDDPGGAGRGGAGGRRQPIDGCSGGSCCRWRRRPWWWCAVFAFTASWRELLYALVLVQAKDKMTAPIGLTSYVVGDTFYWGQMMAAATIMSLPPLLLYMFGQRWVIQGWTAGAVKS